MDDKLNLLHERIAEYLKQTRTKTKGEEAADLGIGLTTYLRYESGDPGSLGVSMHVLVKIAARDKISVTKLVSILEGNRLPKESEVSPEHQELAKLFRSCPRVEIREILDSLYEKFPKPELQGDQFSPYVGALGEYGKWVIGFLGRVLLLPIHELALLEREVYIQLYRTGKLSKKECNDRARVIAIEIEKYLKSRDFTI